MPIIQGLPASPGVAVGPAWIFQSLNLNVERYKIRDAQSEINRFQIALVQAKKQLADIHTRAVKSIGEKEAAIFNAHQMFLDDPEFQKTIHNQITNESINAESALLDGVDHFSSQLEKLDDEYFRSRAQDVRDVGRRVLCCLLGVNPEKLTQMPDEPVIVLAEDLTPSDTIQFDREKLLGMCTIQGGPTSHTAILARSLGIPAAVSVPFDLDAVTNQQLVILDGIGGNIHLQPDDEAIVQAENKRRNWLISQETELKTASEPATTRDGHTIEVVANISGLDDARIAMKFGAEGVGLFRTEFLFLQRDEIPSEKEQVKAYKDIFKAIGNKPVVVRTLDIGGDKELPHLGMREEPNPFLGWRAIRMATDQPELLFTQLRALLNAGTLCDIRIMIPMISSLDEILFAKNIFDKAMSSLLADKKSCALDAQFGIMVEVPSAAIQANEFATEVDFFSIGTNDLTQYTLAVDRTNQRVAHLASPFHPAVLKLIDMTIQAAHEHGKWVGLCGEMAGEPLATQLLLGLGLDEFSAAPSSIPRVKHIIRKSRLKECQEIAQQALTYSSTAEVIAYLSKKQPT